MPSSSGSGPSACDVGQRLKARPGHQAKASEHPQVRVVQAGAVVELDAHAREARRRLPGAAVQPLPRHPEVRPDATGAPSGPGQRDQQVLAAPPHGLEPRPRERAQRPRRRRTQDAGGLPVGARPRTLRPSAQRRRLRAATSTSGSSGMSARGRARGSAPAAVAGDQLRVLGADRDEAHAGAAEAARDARRGRPRRAPRSLPAIREARTPDRPPCAGTMNVPRGRFMVMPDGVMSSAWQSCTLAADRLLDGEHGRHPLRLAAIPRGCGADRCSWVHLKTAVRERKKLRSPAYFRGWASSMMKFGMSSTTG